MIGTRLKLTMVYSTGIVDGEWKVAVDGLNAVVGLFVQDKMKAGDSIAQLSQVSATGRWWRHYRPGFVLLMQVIAKR